MADEDIIRTTGLDLKVLDDQKSILLSFESLGRDPVRVSMPLAVAVRFAEFIQEKMGTVQPTPIEPGQLN